MRGFTSVKVIAAVASLSLATAVQAVDTVKIACVGNSITWGGGGTDSLTYPRFLQTMLNQYHGTDTTWIVYNLGVSGRTAFLSSSSAFAKCDSFKKVFDYKPNWVIMKLGTVDATPQQWNPDSGRDSARFYADYNKMIDTFLTIPTVSKVFACAPAGIWPNTLGISPSRLRDNIIPIIRMVAQQRSIPYIDIYETTMKAPKYFSDGVHPNVAGKALIAHAVYRGICCKGEEAASYPISVTALDGGTVTHNAPATAQLFDSMWVKATAAQGYHFVKWITPYNYADIANSLSDSTQAKVVWGPTTVQARFKQPVSANLWVWSWNYQPTPRGTVKPEGKQTLTENVPLQITATPRSGFRFTSWTVISGLAVIADLKAATTTVRIVDGNATINAFFDPVTPVRNTAIQSNSAAIMQIGAADRGIGIALSQPANERVVLRLYTPGGRLAWSADLGRLQAGYHIEKPPVLRSGALFIAVAESGQCQARAIISPR
jgi:lysophospholipase L1-like esterase